MKKKILIIILSVLIVIASITLFLIKKDIEEKELLEQQQLEEALRLQKEEEERITYELAHPYVENDLKIYEENLEKIAEENGVVGMSVVAFKDEEIINIYNYGYADKDNQILVDGDTCFRIASTSKMISNMLIMKLVDEGKINLDDELKDVTGLAYADGVKLYHVLTHTSGLRDSNEYNTNMGTVYDINYLLKISAKKKPGETYCYSNFGAGTMAAIVEKLTNVRFYDYAYDNLFKPLGLNASYITEYLNEGTEVAKLYYDNYVIDPLNWIYNKTFFDKFEIGNQYRLAHGSLYISSTDLAKLGMVLAGDGSYNGTKILSEKALEQIRTVYDEAEGYQYKMGLNTDIFDDYVEGRTIYGHTGSAYNAITCLMYDPSDKTGVVVLTNYSNVIKNEDGRAKILYDTVNETYRNFFTFKNNEQTTK